MQQFISEYRGQDKTAQVISVNGVWGCNYYMNNELVKTELYEGHSESYAEDAAENYALGVKQL
jgi:hypothetical protein